jgi:hypothetical protein
MGRGWISIITQVCAEKVMKHEYDGNGGSMSIFMNEYKRAFIEEDKGNGEKRLAYDKETRKYLSESMESGAKNI